jgi:hypothetical protein
MLQHRATSCKVIAKKASEMSDKVEWAVYTLAHACFALVRHRNNSQMRQVQMGCQEAQNLC